MKKSVISWFARLFNREVCTVDQFSHACDVAKERAKKDADGKITVCEALNIMWLVILSKE